MNLKTTCTSLTKFLNNLKDQQNKNDILNTLLRIETVSLKSSFFVGGGHTQSLSTDDFKICESYEASSHDNVLMPILQHMIENGHLFEAAKMTLIIKYLTTELTRERSAIKGIKKVINNAHNQDLLHVSVGVYDGKWYQLSNDDKSDDWFASFINSIGKAIRIVLRLIIDEDAEISITFEIERENGKFKRINVNTEETLMSHENSRTNTTINRIDTNVVQVKEDEYFIDTIRLSKDIESLVKIMDGQSGGKSVKKKYNGRMYVLRRGPKGGTYILVHKKKIYI